MKFRYSKGNFARALAKKEIYKYVFGHLLQFFLSAHFSIIDLKISSQHRQCSLITLE